MSKKNKKRTVNTMNEKETPIPDPELEAAEEEQPEVIEGEVTEQPAGAEEAPEQTEEAEEEIVLTAEQAKALKAELDKLREEKDSVVDLAKHIQADFENYRKRNEKISAESRDDGVREVVKAVLPVLDNFDRAMANAPEDDPFVDGVKIIAKQLYDALAKCGLEEVEADGMFDPNLHEAVMKDSTEGVESGMITAVFQKGYRVRGRIIRHTMVKVNE